MMTNSTASQNAFAYWPDVAILRNSKLFDHRPDTENAKGVVQEC